MKVIERKPLRHRGRSEKKRQATKEAIRDVYANGPQKAVQIIPAKKDLIPEGEKKKLRVCAYCRVSTDEDNQASSYELQVQNYIMTNDFVMALCLMGDCSQVNVPTIARVKANLAVGTHPAIISEEQFNAVQEERKRRSNKVVTEDGSRRSTTRYSSKEKPSVG